MRWRPLMARVKNWDAFRAGFSLQLLIYVLVMAPLSLYIPDRLLVLWLACLVTDGICVPAVLFWKRYSYDRDDAMRYGMFFGQVALGVLFVLLIFADITMKPRGAP